LAAFVKVPGQEYLVHTHAVTGQGAGQESPATHSGAWTTQTLKTFNQVYSSLSMRRRYEVWFIRLGLADGAGAWWFRYLLMNPGRRGCPADARGMPVQVWATWFPADGKPQSFIQGFSAENLELSSRGQNPFHFRIGNNGIKEGSCRGLLTTDGHAISWDLHYRSLFHFTLSDKRWIGFSRTPHSDAVFSGQIAIDGQRFEGNPLGFGIQGHNCGYRHRTFWTWAHAHFLRPSGPTTTLEALLYDIGFGLVFRKAVLWHDGKVHQSRNLREDKNPADQFAWNFGCSMADGFHWEAAIDGTGCSLHRVPYLKTDCSGSFEVWNNSLARASLRLEQRGAPIETLETNIGAVLEMGGLRHCGE
jgi:hypothetical protein